MGGGGGGRIHVRSEAMIPHLKLEVTGHVMFGWLNLEFSQGKIKHLGWTKSKRNASLLAEGI